MDWKNFLVRIDQPTKTLVAGDKVVGRGCVHCNRTCDTEVNSYTICASGTLHSITARTKTRMTPLDTVGAAPRGETGIEITPNSGGVGPLGYLLVFVLAESPFWEFP